MKLWTHSPPEPTHSSALTPSTGGTPPAEVNEPSAPELHASSGGANTLSVGESRAAGNEADALCRFVEQHADPMRRGELGKRVETECGTADLLRTGQNTIYRISGAFRWYLKLPRDPTTSAIAREIAGAQSVRATLGDFPAYLHSKAIRGSVDSAFLLTGEVPGTHAGRSLSRACVLGMLGISAPTWEAFSNFGSALARLHGYRDTSLGLECDRIPNSRLLQVLEEVRDPNEVSQEIAEWADGLEEPAEAPVWSHGNIKSGNVILWRDRVCIIDFENCGLGSAHQDLAGLGYHMILPRALPVYPWRRARKAMNAMLQGYRLVREYDRDLLLYHLTQRICRRYITSVALRRRAPKVAGLALSRPKLDRLTRSWLHSAYDEALEGIDL